MLLYPIEEKDETSKIKEAFKEIRNIFKTSQPPLVFRFLANFEEYFLFLWNKIRKNIETEFFNENIFNLKNLMENSLRESFKPSSNLVNYLKIIGENEKKNLRIISEDINNQNLKLLIILIAIRENLKGVFVGELKLDKIISSYEKIASKGFFKDLNSKNYELNNLTKSLIISSHNSLQFSSLSDFFSVFQTEFEKYIFSEEYLIERLKIEKFSMDLTENFPYSIGASYKQIIEMIGNKDNFKDMLHLLTDYFPTLQPRITFTSSAILFLLNN